LSKNPPYDAPVIFYAYSRQDEVHLTALRMHLALLKRLGRIADWHDRKILPGQTWERILDEHLETADIILLLVSPSFIASDYCWGKEMNRALERQEDGRAVVIPIIVRPSDGWETAPFGHLQALPNDGKPITEWSSRDRAWANVAEGIRTVIDHL
jgi:hypothetical protein